MKKINSILVILILNLTVKGQFKTDNQQLQRDPNVPSGVKSDYVRNQNYLSKNTLTDYNSFYGDSLKGFNEALIKAELLSKGLYGTEFIGYLNRLKRIYIAKKYYPSLEPITNSSSSNYTKQIGGNNSINVVPCVNEGFEATGPGFYTSANAVFGWTLSSRTADGNCNPTAWSPGSSEFSVVATPLSNINFIGTLPNSPLGGNTVVQLNNFNNLNHSSTKIAQTFPVTAANSFFQFAYAGVWQDGGAGHGCCDQPFFKVLIKDCSGTMLVCPSLDLTAFSPSCSASYSTNNIIPGYVSWCNWIVRSIDLTPYIGTCVTVEAICADCAFGGHFGAAFFDAQCGNQFSPSSPSTVGNTLGGQVNFCSGSNYASLQAPLGYASYSWVPPATHPILSVAQATQASITTSNAVAGNTFTVNLVSYSGCFSTAVYTLTNSLVNISSIGSSPSCAMGNAGSATVIASGSGSGYNYSWLNSTNSVVATSSVASNLPQGNYTVSATAIGSPGCGAATSTTAISVGPQPMSVLSKRFCGNEAYLSAPATGTNYQWYNGSAAISTGLGGTASTYTVISASINSYFSLSYLTNQGCRDSVIFALYNVQPGYPPNITTQLSCSGSNTGLAAISFTPSASAPTASNSFFVYSTGTTPTYSSYLNPTSLNSYTANNLPGNGTFSLSIFDGICKYNSTFSVGAYPSFNFSFNVANSQTICNGNNLLANIILPNNSLPSDFTYSWAPTTFLFANNGNQQQTLITPTSTPGGSVTTIYTVIVTPTLANCPQTKTLSLTYANPLTPTVIPIPPLCSNSAIYSISAVPSGGSYLNNYAVTLTGLISPSLAAIGINTFTYITSLANCITTVVSNFYVNAVPVLSVSGNFSICQGQSTTLLANGTGNFNWINYAPGPIINVSPTANSTYTVIEASTTNSCSNSTVITVSVMSLPVLSISGTSLCSGNGATLTASGAGIYLWNNITQGSTYVIPLPVNSSTYSVLGTNTISTCTNSIIVTLTITPSPTISVISNYTLCAGESITLNASGASTYSWNNGAVSQNILASPLTNTTYTVVGGNVSGSCSDTKTISVIVSECTGIEKNKITQGLLIYPNPTNGKFFIATENKITIFLSDELGRKILEETFEKGIHQIDLSNYASGMYILKTSDSKETKITKLVKKD